MLLSKEGYLARHIGRPDYTNRASASVALPGVFARAGARLLSALPSAPVVALTARVLHRFPTTYGMPRGGARVTAAVAGYREAFPEANAEDFLRAWSNNRAKGLAFTIAFLARKTAGRSGGLAHSGSDGGRGAAVVVFIHTNIDPVPVMALLDASPQNDYLWAMFPVNRGPETNQRWKDDRDVLLSLGSLPPQLEEILLSVTSPSWLPTAIRHLRNGGRVLIAADSAFDGDREAEVAITVGDARLPLTPAIEMLARLGRADLHLLLPELKRDGPVPVETRPVSSASELADLISRWIAAHPLDWAGWPFIAARRKMSTVRNGTSISI